jgi:4-amino-4-deoxy-L-arabinose transferase-like glycosyltransferase
MKPSAAMLRDRRAAVALIAVSTLILGLVLLFSLPASEPNIEAEVRVEGLDRSLDTTVMVSKGRVVSLEWGSEDEALIQVVAPRHAVITVFAGNETVTFTLHELIMYTEEERATALGQVSLQILEGKVVDWYANLLEEAYAALYANRFVLAVLLFSSLAYVWVRRRAGYAQLAPLVIVAAFLTYQVLFFLDLTPTLYWDTPLSDPYVRVCLGGQMLCSILLIVLWFPLRRLVSKVRPDLLGFPAKIIDRWGLVILIAVPLLQHLIGHGVLGYNLQPTDARYTYMAWGQEMFESPIRWTSQRLLTTLNPALLSFVWGLLYRLFRDGYLASALTPLLFLEIAVIGTFLLGKELFGHRVGFYAGLLLSIIPVFSFQGYFVMTDVPSAAMTVLTVCLFMFALRRDSMRLAVLSGVCLVLSVLARQTCLYGIFLMVVVYFLVERRKKRVLLGALACLVLLPMIYLIPRLAYHTLSWENLQKDAARFAEWSEVRMFQRGDRRPPGWYYEILKSGQTHYYMGPSSRLFYFEYLANAMGFPIFFWAVFILVDAIEARFRGFRDQISLLSRDRNKLIALAVWILVLLLFMSPWSMRNTRMTYIAFPAYAMLGAYGFGLLKTDTRFGQARHGNLLLGLTVIMLVTQSLAHYYNVSYLKNADYRDPIFIESSEAYYYVHRFHNGWHVAWSGAGTGEHDFSGILTTDGQFTDALYWDQLFRPTRPTAPQLTVSPSTLSFEGQSSDQEDGFEFVVEGGSWISFDLLIDGVRYPGQVYIYTGSIGIHRGVPSTVPFTLEAQ